MRWGPEQDVDLYVYIGAAGPFEEPFTAPFIDVTDKVRGEDGITIKRGRSDEFTAFQSGSCTLTLRNDGREFDPSVPGLVTLDGGSSGLVPVDLIDAGASSSPAAVFDAAAEANSSPFAAILEPLRILAVVAVYASQLKFLFVGFVDGWPRTWSKTTGSVRIEAHDHLRVMARTMTSPSFGVLVLDHPDDGKLDTGRLIGELPQQFSGQRVETLLQLAGFGGPGQLLDIDTGLTEVLTEEPTGNILGLIQSVERAEAGFFFVAADGTIRFLDRHARFRAPRTGTVQAVFTDSQYTDLEVERDLTQVWNDVAFTRPDGLEQRVVDDASAHDYGYISLREQIPVVSDPEAQARAEFWVDRYGRPQDRPGPIVILPRKNMPGLFPKVIDRELLDRIQIERTPLGVTPTSTYTGLVESIEHRITNESWVTVLATSPIDVSEGDAFLILDDATLGQLDSHTLAY